MDAVHWVDPERRPKRIPPTGLLGEPLDMESRAIMTEDEVNGLPEQMDVARLMLKLYGVEESAEVSSI